MSLRGTKRACGVRGEEPGTSRRREEPGTSKRREELGTSKRREEPGTSKRREEPGPSKRREEPGTSKRREEPSTSKRREEPGTSKRRRMDPDDAHWHLRPNSDLKMSSIYNRSASEAPAELFRKDLISAMKLPDSEPLTSSEYWIITDTWKQDWERGVQVPVNPDSLPAPKVKIIDNPYPPNFKTFKLPKDKYIHLTRDANYLPDKHLLSNTPAKAEAACNYDLDATDTAWLKLLNAERARAGAPSVTEDQLEKVIEELEVRTWDKIQAIMKSEEGLGIEYDENVICDVCRSPDSEDGNEMVFCDSCNICVHQACYGITVIPDGQWLCRPCGVGVKPTCALCPNLGGAMKCTPSGHKWAHVSCVLWIPEVSIGCAEKMEPITKITSIPASRWSLVCVLCRERKGACIQCSVKTCKTAYHVTCAFKHGLEMRAIIEDENADDGVKLRSYCQKHSVNSKKEKCPGSGSEEEEVKRKRRKDMTSEEKTQARAARLQEIEREFDKHVSIKDISSHLLDIDQDTISYIYNYWKLKRRAGHNRPLLPPKSDDNELLTHRQEQADLDKMKMFVQLRQDLERVRNLCYMVSRREKLSRSFFRMREQTFHKQVSVLSSEQSMAGPELQAIIEANHGPSIYDRLYSHPNAPDHKNSFEALLARIAPQDSSDEKKPARDRNGLNKRQRSSNPYKKLYVNGSRRSGSMYSGLSSEESAPEVSRSTKYRGRAVGSSTEEDVKKSTSPKKKVSPKSKAKKSPKKPERKKRKVPQSKAFVESSSEDETDKTRIKKDRSRSKTLEQMEKEMTAGKMGQSGTDSDDFIPIRTTRNNKLSVNIYSDSSDETSAKEECKPQKSDKIKVEKTKSERGRPPKSPKDNDSQQSLPRTKAAMKEFIPSQSEKKTPVVEEKPMPKKRGRKPSNKEKKPPIKSSISEDETKNKENVKILKQKDNPSDLIVPQRQAAKKASENMRSTTVAKKEEPGTEKQVSGDDSKTKPKIKSKGKEVKDVPAKVGRKKSSKDQEKETIAYVPQRQAAKKAAAHIKSGLGTKAPVPESLDADKKKEMEKSESTKISPKNDESKFSPKKEESKFSPKKDETKFSPKKEDIKRAKTPEDETSSSSSNTSSSSDSSSSSSDDEPEKPGMKPTAKAREIKPAIRQPSMFSPPGSRPTVDLPFLDKVSRPLSSTSASSGSESSRESRYSGSESPSPKRPRRRRKTKSISTDVSLRKAPDKKLKTSEREPERRVPSPVIEREESSRPIARAATRARTRSTTTSGNMSNKSDARPRKPSKDEPGNATSIKTPKESSQPSKLPTPKRKADEEIKKEISVNKYFTQIDNIAINDNKNKTAAGKTRSISVEDKEKPKSAEGEGVPSVSKISRTKSTDTKHKKVFRRMSTIPEIDSGRRAIPEEIAQPPRKMRRLSKYESTISDSHNLSPVKKINITTECSPHKTSMNILDKKHTCTISDDFADTDKNWLPKAPSPKAQTPPAENPCSHEKYMTEDKSMDSDSADKNSIKMIAKIQANLNENTMIKSPKTPMDARTITMDSIEIENPVMRKSRCSILDIEKKFLNQDTNLVQGVEISKSAKIPSAANQFSNRAMFSPQSKDNEFFAFDMMAVDDGFNNEDVMIKPFTYPEFFFKEDSKDQGVQETLNLVDRLRMQLSSKKAPSVNSQDDIDVAGDGDEKEQPNEESAAARNLEITERQASVPKKTVTHTEVHDRRSHSKEDTDVMKTETESVSLTSRDKNVQPVTVESNEKWSDVPLHQSEPYLGQMDESKYDTIGSYSEDGKEQNTRQSDVISVSEIGDSVSLSKQSDDSQSLSVVDHSVHSNDVELTQDNQNFENNNSVIHSDCATISSPYMRRESKITTRRSSASSTNSEASVCSQKAEIKTHLASSELHPNVIPELDPYPPLPTYACRVDSQLPSFTSYPSEPSPFLGAMGLQFAGACASSQLQLPSPAPSLYAPGLAYHGAPLIQPLPKPQFTLCAAAFTSSSQNIALTTAMIAPPTPKPLDSPRDDNDASGSDKVSIHVVSSPSISVDSFNETSRAPTKMSNDSDETSQSTNTQEPKSPPKSVKSITKFPVKSPGKSPDISPKQNDSSKSSKRSSNRSSRSHRGRGRSKSRGHGYTATDFSGNSIQSKLVGTVYDFDEEIANDGVDIKALRERRKSTDLREDRRSEHSYKDSSQSPSLASPKTNKRPATETRESKPHTPEVSEQSQSPTNNSTSDRPVGFSDVRPVLPGPVDMRTYSFENPAPTPGDGFHSHLLAFASGTADQQLADIDEEVEKQLHTELMASKPRPGSPQATLSTEIREPIKETFTPLLPKVSLSDSRNQLKVKIKGPFLDANYSASSVQPVVPPPPPAHDSNTNIFSASSSASSSMMTGSTNLRRMRKKELLRQYWTQDMNMDDPTSALTMGIQPPPAQPQPLARAVITIPKAVASMTSIPTREDYKITDTPIEKKKRKITSGLSRELRHLEVSMNDDVDTSDDMKLSSIAGTSSQMHKRRGRVSTKPNRSNPTSPVAPKLKIKISSNVVQQVNDEPSGFQIRPPKKRLPTATIPKPRLEDLRREYMKYRRKVMADFEEDEKTKKYKSDKSEKRKKKKEKKSEKEKLRVINSESESATKLIIKIKRTKEEESAGVSGTSGAVTAAAAVPEPPVDPFEYDPTAKDPLAIDPPVCSDTVSAVRKVRTAKVTPIRLKLSRSSQGTRYVMKETGEASSQGVVPASPPGAEKKHGDVR